VLLFYVLMMGHPLIGRREFEFACWDEGAESILFGSEPLFVFDPDNDTNAPDRNYHAGVVQSWTLYPAWVRDLFVQAFTTGLRDPRNGRVRESVWRVALARLRDTITHCANCAKENFVPRDMGSRPCWFCDDPVRPTAWLVADGQAVTLSAGTVVTSHHLRHDYDFQGRVGEVVVHPVNPHILGLRNETSDVWSVSLDDGEVRDVEPGKSVRIANDTAIDFANGSTGRIEAL
jgi:DNA-binding helix-hairpin-helix protein with protein kinase domain